jgi:hypothetical protein
LSNCIKKLPPEYEAYECSTPSREQKCEIKEVGGAKSKRLELHITEEVKQVCKVRKRKRKPGDLSEQLYSITEEEMDDLVRRCLEKIRKIVKRRKLNQRPLGLLIPPREPHS